MVGEDVGESDFLGDSPSRTAKPETCVATWVRIPSRHFRCSYFFVCCTHNEYNKEPNRYSLIHWVLGNTGEAIEVIFKGSMT
jgi:hypothetical protein